MHGPAQLQAPMTGPACGTAWPAWEADQVNSLHWCQRLADGCNRRCRNSATCSGDGLPQAS